MRATILHFDRGHDPAASQRVSVPLPNPMNDEDIDDLHDQEILRIYEEEGRDEFATVKGLLLMIAVSVPMWWALWHYWMPATAWLRAILAK
jgi:hypothetical protein